MTRPAAEHKPLIEEAKIAGEYPPPAERTRDNPKFLLGIESNTSPEGTIYFLTLYFTSKQLEEPLALLMRIKDQALTAINHIRSTWIPERK